MMLKFSPALLCVHFVSVFCTTVQYCWQGSSDDWINRRNLSCATGVTSLGDATATRVLPSHSGSNTPTDQKPGMAARKRSYNCMAFEQTETVDDGSGAMMTTSTMIFTCDTDTFCVGKSMREGSKIQYKGNNGTLFCCNDANNCNTPDIKKHRHSCYNAAYDDQQQSLVRTEVCPHEETLCISKRVKDEADVIISETFRCDDYQECAKKLPQDFINKACISIHNNETSMETELCCCHGDRCIVPDWLDREPGEVKNDASRYTTHWQRIVLIVLGTALGLIVVFVALFFIRRGKQNAKREAKARRKPNKRMVHISTLSDDEDEDHMRILS